jgi:NAD(P)-dependent dehydrogenase (short-subunit alcohol dehydrogenase family)
MKRAGEHTAAPTSLFRVDGLTAVVTGASRGIGEGCARLLAALGAHVVLVARNLRDLQIVVSEIEACGGSAEYWVLDLKSLPEFKERVSSLPALDIFVNNAGINKPQSFFAVDTETFDELFNLNVRVSFFCAQIAAQRMVETRRAGSIVMISSQAGHVGLPDRSVYCSTKFAIEGMTKAIALEAAQFGIRVNTVAPTYVATPMTEPMFRDPKFSEFVQANIPMGRMATVEEVAAAVAYLAAPASRIVTGTSLLVDGGWTMK